MIGRLALGFVLIAVPAFAQSRVYTNADLGKIPRTMHTITEEELESLRAHQFVYHPPLPRGPQVIRIYSSTTDGPFGPFYMPPRLPLGTGSSYYSSDWSYGYSGYWGHRLRGPITVSVPNLSLPAPITVPDFARGPASPFSVAPGTSRGPLSIGPVIVPPVRVRRR